MKPYRSPYEAYPFLSEPSGAFSCDFEVATDEAASLIGLLRAKVEDKDLRADLAHICALVYHANPTLRTRFTVTGLEIAWLKDKVDTLQAQNDLTTCFVLPLGSEAACTAHVIRTKCKALVRLIYRHIESGGEAEDALLDFTNLLSGYFFLLALKLNRIAATPEVTFQSRNYN